MLMSNSTHFMPDNISLSTTHVQSTSPPADWSYFSTDTHHDLWSGRQLSQPRDLSSRKTMVNDFLTQSEFTVGNAGSEYTITTQFTADDPQSHDPCVVAPLWPNMYHPSNWNQLCVSDFPGNLTSTSVLNNNYPQPTLVTGSPNAYDGISATGTPTSCLSSPSTSSTHRSFSSPSSNKDLLLASVDTKTPDDVREPKYSHREQLTMFREALKLPMDGAGPFIPQQMYKPHTTSDRKRYVEEVLLEAPLFFYSGGSTRCGILLKDALHSRTRKLQNRDKAVFEGRGPSVSIRLEWPGYRQWSKQIPTKDFRNPPCPITLAKLARNVAKCVQRFIQERRTTVMEDDSDHRWRIGDGPNDIKLEDLILVSMHHVSLGSWQPQLRLVRPRELSFRRPPITVIPPNTEAVSPCSLNAYSEFP